MTPTPFIFGKAPAHGDFIARGLSPGSQEVWDHWASAEIETARDRLSERFDGAHDLAPPWGFVSGPGPLGEAWRAGAFAASVDSAGRRFLLIVGYDGLPARQAAFVGALTAAACDVAIRRILIETLDADAALEALSQAAPEAGTLNAADALQSDPTAAGVWWSMAGLVEPTAKAAPPEGLVSTALARVAELLEAPV